MPTAPGTAITAAILDASWPDGAHDGFPSAQVARMIGDHLLASGWHHPEHTVITSGQLNGFPDGTVLVRPGSVDGRTWTVEHHADTVTMGLGGEPVRVAEYVVLVDSDGVQCPPAGVLSDGPLVLYPLEATS